MNEPKNESMSGKDQQQEHEDLAHPKKDRFSRRNFIQSIGVGAAGYALASFTPGKAMAGPFGSRKLGEHLIPADKKLSQSWINSLTMRKTGETYQGQELRYVGMPIGGIGCGQLYLGGDGRLWLWDIFKSNYRREPDHGQKIAAFSLGGHYANPIAFGEQYTKYNGTQVEQGFLVRAKSGGKSITRTLDKEGFPAVTFRGEYPVGRVTYTDTAFPAKVELEAFSPFIPLNTKDSALPATVMSFTVTNTTDEPIQVDLGGWLQNATTPYLNDPALGNRRNRLIKNKNRYSVVSTVEGAKKSDQKGRKDIVFADFETDNWGKWVAEGDAFKGGPFSVSSLEKYQNLKGVSGKAIVNSLNTRESTSPSGADALTGKLSSPSFKVERKYIQLSVAGGKNASEVYVEVLVDGKQVGKITGDNSLVLKQHWIDMSKYQGESAQIRIVDQAKGSWAHIVADQIVFTDQRAEVGNLEEKHGYGSSALSVIAGDGVIVTGCASLKDPSSPAAMYDQLVQLEGDTSIKPLDQLLVGGMNASMELQAGESKTVTYLITWYFPYHLEQDAEPGQLSQRTTDFAKLSRHYRPWFNSAGDVADYIATNAARIIGGTLEWNKTWYDSTLPHWLLDRSFISLDCVATQMFHWFDNGRPWAWEGVDCCPGTCTHVFHYAQAMGRIFPELERNFREMTDYGVGFNSKTGMISDRGDHHSHEATDGQAGTILRVYREHQMSADDAFLQRLWPRVKQSIEFLIAKDQGEDGLIDGAQPHTLDAAWHGPMAWMSSLYLAALAAGEAMAEESNDADFAKRCRTILDRGSKRIVSELFDGEYFIHKPDPKKPRSLRTGDGCHIDQVLGQGWANQVGLGRIIPKKETVSALNSLWKYNFAPDAGQYAMDHIQIEQAFRWYAMQGEAGLVMCTWPKGGAEDAIPGKRLRSIKNPDRFTGPGGYFNECMNGFEYQVAGHMVAEGEPDSSLVKKGLSIFKAVHERYAPDARNPYNEIECSDHYARSMASYGVFLAVCGYAYNGPLGHLSFAPKITPEDFKAPFTTAEGWGSFTQKQQGNEQIEIIDFVYGSLTLNQLNFELADGKKANDVVFEVDGKTQQVHMKQSKNLVKISLPKPILIKVGEQVKVQIRI